MGTRVAACWNICIGFIIGFVLLDQASCSGQNLNNQSTTLSAYYALLDSLYERPLDQHIMSLQNFVEHHPVFQRGYSTLYNSFCAQSKQDEAYAYFDSLSNWPSAAPRCHWILGLLCYEREKIDEALIHFKAAVAIDHADIILYDVVRFYHLNQKHFEGRISLDELAPDPHAFLLSNALLLHVQKKYLQFIEMNNANELGARNNLQWMHLVGESYYRMGYNNKADSIWAHGLELATQERDWHYVSKFLADRATIERAQGNFQTALSLYDSSNVYANRYYYFRQLQINAGNRGNIYNILGEYEKAERAYKKAIEIAENYGFDDLLVYWTFNYAQCVQCMSNYNLALKYYNLAEAAAKNANNYAMELQVKVAKAELYIYFNMGSMALPILERALKEYPDEQLALYCKAILALVLIEKGEYKQARHNIEEYINSIKKYNDARSLAYWMNQLAQLYVLEKKLSDAKELFTEIAALTETAGLVLDQAWYLTDIANILSRQKDFTDALEYCMRALELTTKESSDDLLIQIYHTFGDIYRRNSDIENAIVYYKKALPFLEKTEHELSAEKLRIGFTSSKYTLFRKLVYCYYEGCLASEKEGEIDSVFYYTQLSRGRTQRNKQQIETKTENFKSQYNQKCDEFRRFQRTCRLSMINQEGEENFQQQISEWEAHKYSLLEARIQQERDDPSREYELAEPVALKKIRTYMHKKKAAFLTYHLSPLGCFAIAITKDATRLVPLDADHDSLSALVNSLMLPFYMINTSQSIDSIPYKADVANRLYHHLIAPVENAIALPERLIIQPDAVLFHLPFDILLVDSTSKKEYFTSDFPDYAAKLLINSYSITYASTPDIIFKSSNLKRKNANVLVFANPFNNASSYSENGDSLRSFTGWNFTPLPFAEKEAYDIARLYPQAQLYTQVQATKNALLQLPQSGILHIASHGFIDANFEQFSGLVLSLESDEDFDDGFLMGYEIEDMNLNYELVVLNACETARGKTMPGEGLLGLPRAFLGSGAKTVLTTYWKIDDYFSSLLMMEFYKNLQNREYTKDLSLWHAKRNFLRESASVQNIYFQHPFYWAAYNLYGDPGHKTELSVIILLITILLSCSISISILFYIRNRHYFPK